MEFPLLLAKCRNRWSPALLQESDFSTPTFHCFLGIEREEKNSTSVTRERRPRDKLQHSCMNTKSPSAATKRGHQTIQVPEAIQIPHSMTSTCTRLYMSASKIRTVTTTETIAFLPLSQLDVQVMVLPLSFSHGFGSHASCHGSVPWWVWSNSTLSSNVARLSNEISTLRVWGLCITTGNQEVPFLTSFLILSPEGSGGFFQTSYGYINQKCSVQCNFCCFHLSLFFFCSRMCYIDLGVK